MSGRFLGRAIKSSDVNDFENVEPLMNPSECEWAVQKEGVGGSGTDVRSGCVDSSTH